jgi:AhpD family alkylhydroperoxidase
MARVAYLSAADATTTEARAVWHRLETERPQPTGNVFRAIAHAPAVLAASLTYGAALRNETEIDSKLRELAILGVAHAAGVKYAIAHHSGPAVLHGATDEQLADIENFETSDAFDNRERAVIRLAYESTRSVHVSDAVWNAASVHFSDKELVELVLNIAYYNNGVRIMGMLDIELEERFITDPVGAFLTDIGAAR